MPHDHANLPVRTIHPRLEQGVSDRLDAYCQRERRNITAAVNLLLDKALADYEAARAASRKAAR